MNFGQALELLKAGKCCARKSWKEKSESERDMFVFLVPASDFKVNRHPLLGIYPEDTEIHYNAHIDVKRGDNNVSPWTALQSDMLADDWYEVLR
jgi:hypothetical protein